RLPAEWHVAPLARLRALALQCAGEHVDADGRRSLGLAAAIERDVRSDHESDHSLQLRDRGHRAHGSEGELRSRLAVSGEVEYTRAPMRVTIEKLSYGGDGVARIE